MIGQELQTQYQESETAKQDHDHEQAHSKSDAAEVIEPRPREGEDDWVILVDAKLKQARADNSRSKSKGICIYRVPPYLYENNKKSYFPQTVSIGPYHYGKVHLQAMECHKWRAVSMVLERTNQKFETYLEAMRSPEVDTYGMYEGPILLRDNKFREMLVVDGCFVLELLEGVAKEFTKLGYAHNDPVFAIGGLMHSIRRDMLMLENQIPFSVLCKLAEIQKRAVVVRNLVDDFFDPLMPTSGLSTNTPDGPTPELPGGDLLIQEEVDTENEMHCLNLFRHRLLTGKSSLDRCKRDKLPLVADKRQQRMIHCVTELRDAGFKFRKRKTGSFFWDIEFSEGYLEIPKLLINDGTKCLFLNLIAFEQRHIYSSNYVTSYIIFMDNLIDSAEDVHYLRQCGIIEHSLGSDTEVADMFNGLCHEVVFHTGDVYLSGLLNKVESCYKRRYFRKWNSWMRTLKNKYFDSPWAYLSFFAALILLFLTCAQTYFAAYDYFKSGS